MDVENKLRRGMSIPETCWALSGWRFEYLELPDSSPLCTTWDFFDPFDDKTIIRVTFRDGSLLAWGTPPPDALAGRIVA